MGEEIEAAIYNDGNGRKATADLKKYVNLQMDRIMTNKMNQTNTVLQANDFVNTQPIDLSNIEKNEMLFFSPLKTKRRKQSDKKSIDRKSNSKERSDFPVINQQSLNMRLQQGFGSEISTNSLQKIVNILEPKSHQNFLNMVEKTQSRKKQTQAPKLGLISFAPKSKSVRFLDSMGVKKDSIESLKRQSKW